MVVGHTDRLHSFGEVPRLLQGYCTVHISLSRETWVLTDVLDPLILYVNLLRTLVTTKMYKCSTSILYTYTKSEQSTCTFFIV